MRFTSITAAVALVAGASAYSNNTVVAPYSNATAVYTPPAGTAAPSASVTGAMPTFTGAANKAYAASGAGLAAVLGLAAYAL